MEPVSSSLEARPVHLSVSLMSPEKPGRGSVSRATAFVDVKERGAAPEVDRISLGNLADCTRLPHRDMGGFAFSALNDSKDMEVLAGSLRRSGRADLELLVVFNSGVEADNAGEHARAVGIFERHMEAVAKAGDEALVRLSLNRIGSSLVSLGDPESLREALRCHLAHTEGAGPNDRVVGLANAALVQALLGEWDEAEALSRSVFALVDPSMGSASYAFASGEPMSDAARRAAVLTYAREAQRLRECGDMEGARGLLMAGVPHGEVVEDMRYMGLLLFMMARLAHDEGDAKAAEKWISRALNLVSARDAVVASIVHGEAAAARGLHKEAHRSFTLAQRLAVEHPDAKLMGRIRCGLGVTSAHLALTKMQDDLRAHQERVRSTTPAPSKENCDPPTPAKARKTTTTGGGGEEGEGEAGDGVVNEDE